VSRAQTNLFFLRYFLKTEKKLLESFSWQLKLTQKRKRRRRLRQFVRQGNFFASMRTCSSPELLKTWQSGLNNYFSCNLRLGMPLTPVCWKNLQMAERSEAKNAPYINLLVHNALWKSSFLTLAGKVINKLALFSLKWLSVAKLKARSEATRQNISNFNFWREASLLASLTSAIFSENKATK
jgi:hypothetical protein